MQPQKKDFVFGTGGQERKRPYASTMSLATPGQTDTGYTIPTREQAKAALQSGMSGVNPEDEAATAAIRDAFGERLQSLQGSQSTRKGQLESDLAQGFKNQVSELRRQAGGTGTMGSSTFAEQAGDLSSNYQNQRAKALLALEEQGLGELGDIQKGLAGARSQDMDERKFQLAQSGALSDLLMETINQDLGREQMLRGIEADDRASKRKMWADVLSGIGQAGGQAGAAALMASDARVKKNISPADSEIEDVFLKAKPYSYEYSEKKHGEGRRISPMAQDLEAHDLSKDMVIEINGIKHVDYGRAFGLMFAAISNLTRDVRDLKNKLASVEG